MQKLRCLMVLIFVCCCGTVRGDGLSLDPVGDTNQYRPDSLNFTQPIRQSDIWHDGIGSGFAARTQQLDFSLVDALGIAQWLGFNNHDIALASGHYGWMFPPLGLGHCYGGNFQILSEFFAGSQYHPEPAYVLGASALIRYNFATGTRFVPFIGGGGGPTATDIGHPDLSMTYNFNLQGGIGAHFFWADNKAVTFEARYFHMSNAGLKRPNDGVNTVSFSLGISWFF